MDDERSRISGFAKLCHIGHAEVVACEIAGQESRPVVISWHEKPLGRPAPNELRFCAADLPLDLRRYTTAQAVLRRVGRGEQHRTPRRKPRVLQTIDVHAPSPNLALSAMGVVLDRRRAQVPCPT